MKFKQERQSENVVIFVKFREIYTFVKNSFLANLGKKFCYIGVWICIWCTHFKKLRQADYITKWISRISSTRSRRILAITVDGFFARHSQYSHVAVHLYLWELAVVEIVAELFGPASIVLLPCARRVLATGPLLRNRILKKILKNHHHPCSDKIGQSLSLFKHIPKKTGIGYLWSNYAV